MEKKVGYHWVRIGDKHYICYWNGTRWINPYRSSINLKDMSEVLCLNVQYIEEPTIEFKLSEPILNKNNIYGYTTIGEKINTVRRYSDNQLFTIGDQIRTSWLNGIITLFEEINNQIRIHFSPTNGQNYTFPNQTVLLKNARKI